LRCQQSTGFLSSLGPRSSHRSDAVPDAAKTASPKPIIIFVVTEDWYFWSHRLPIARAARDSGYAVWVATREQVHGERIRKESFHVWPVDFHRTKMNPLRDLLLIWKLADIYETLRPQIVHHVAIKPVVYGSIAARWRGVPAAINALAGLGFLYAPNRTAAQTILQIVLRRLMAFVLSRVRGRVVVQTSADLKVLRENLKLDADALRLIRGSGVDVDVFVPTPEPEGAVRITLVSRLLWEKGVGEMVAAGRLLRQRGVDCAITLVGTPDRENSGAIDERQLQEWVKAGDAEWWGHRDDVANVWARSHVACLPSYYPEGVPKTLLEAASCGRPIVTSQNPGCLEVVEHGVNGLVVPARDAVALADAIEKLVRDPALRQALGREGRRKVCQEFAQEKVVRETLALYEELR